MSACQSDLAPKSFFLKKVQAKNLAPSPSCSSAGLAFAETEPHLFKSNQLPSESGLIEEAGLAPLPANFFGSVYALASKSKGGAVP